MNKKERTAFLAKKLTMQAILILAHKNFPQVKKLALKLNRSFKVYIHFDKKMNITATELSSLADHNIQYISEVEVNWGSWSIGEATVRLMKLALSDPNISYLHVISGQDWITQNVDDLYQRFENDTKIYMTYEKASEVKKSGEPIIWWQKYYFNYDQINRRTFFGKFYHRALLLGQTLLRIDKFKKLGIELEIYAGANWVDLPRDAANYCVEYLESHPNLQKMLRTGCFSDEFWMQTILCNSPEYRERIINDHHRYIKWEKQHNSYPAILDEHDLDAILTNDYFFARKFEKEYSHNLIEVLDKANKN
jgi:hypothetical protein